ncbi:MAG: leucyl aminopeptidase [Oligoflexia bacterium]|nr:leucyl aminopeptidase [Oligoflexia bacterium]
MTHFIMIPALHKQRAEISRKNSNRISRLERNIIMKVSIKKTKQSEKTLAVFICKGKFPEVLNPYKKDIQNVLKEIDFKGNKKTSVFLPLTNSKSHKYIMILGLGEENSFDYEGVRQAGAKMYKELKRHNQKTADVLVESFVTKHTKDVNQICQAFTESVILSSYKCDEFKKPKKEEKDLKELFICLSSNKNSSCEKAVKEGAILATAANFAKRLANYPGNLMTPSILANEIQEQTKNTKIKTTVWDKKRIEKEKMGGLLGVSLGSPQEPRFIIMEYKGSAKKPVILVGKGLTFDSGGISLKPAQAMDEMKFDMCGSTAVAGAMLAIEKLGLKAHVIGLIPSSENMPGQNANKPGDILKARNGKTMEVLNTDAEGRLILADALSYASEKKPQAIFDAATLTGAIIGALGNLFTGFFTKNENLAKKIFQAGEKTGERVWRLPLTEEHTSDIKSGIADVANISSNRGAGSSTAAAFLEHFVDKDIPWAHFDIAGTAWNVHNRLEYCNPKQASGVMVRTFVELARSYQ